MPVLLVRHADAGDRNAWEDDDDKRPLSERGRLQADGLVSVLRAYSPTVVLSSPSLRCVQTVEPLAAAAGRTVDASPALAEGETRAAADLVRRLVDGEMAVLCSHGDVIPYVLEALEREEGLEFTEPPRWKKASTWVLNRDETGNWSARYLPPPPVAR